MKKFLLICSIAIASCITVNAQSVKKAVAEQTVWSETSASVKISTSSEKIFTDLTKSFEVKRYTVEIKEDRLGKFNVYSISFKKDKIAALEAFFKKVVGK